MIYDGNEAGRLPARRRRKSDRLQLRVVVGRLGYKRQRPYVDMCEGMTCTQDIDYDDACRDEKEAQDHTFWRNRRRNDDRSDSDREDDQQCAEVYAEHLDL